MINVINLSNILASSSVFVLPLLTVLSRVYYSLVYLKIAYGIETYIMTNMTTFFEALFTPRKPRLCPWIYTRGNDLFDVNFLLSSYCCKLLYQVPINIRKITSSLSFLIMSKVTQWGNTILLFIYISAYFYHCFIYVIFLVFLFRPSLAFVTVCHLLYFVGNQPAEFCVCSRILSSCYTVQLICIWR